MKKITKYTDKRILIAREELKLAKVLNRRPIMRRAWELYKHKVFISYSLPLYVGFEALSTFPGCLRQTWAEHKRFIHKKEEEFGAYFEHVIMEWEVRKSWDTLLLEASRKGFDVSSPFD